MLTTKPIFLVRLSFKVFFAYIVFAAVFVFVRSSNKNIPTKLAKFQKKNMKTNKTKNLLF